MARCGFTPGAGFRPGAEPLVPRGIIGRACHSRMKPGTGRLWHGAAWCALTLATWLLMAGPVSARAATRAPASWTTFLGSTLRNPVVPASGGLAPTLAVTWRFPVAPAAADSIVASPAVVGGVAYFGAMNHRVYALNVKTGREIWSFLADNQVMSQPLVVAGRVFFGSGNKRFIGHGAQEIRGAGQNALYALSARTGRLLWKFPVRGEAMPTPAYQDGVLYEATGGRTFYALNAATGRPRWILHEGAIVSMSSPAIAQGIAVFGGRDEGAPSFYGVNLRTHRLAWTTPFPAAWAGTDDLSPTASGGVVYVQVPAGHDRITAEEVALEVRTGRELWQRVLGSGPADYHNGEETGVASLVGGRLYLGSSMVPGVWALLAQTGRVLWHAPLPVAVRAAPAVRGPYVYAVSAGRLFALNRATGAVVGRLVVGYRPAEANAHYVLIPCASPSPTLVGQTLLVAAGAQDVLEALPVSRLLDSGHPPVAATR